MLNLKCSILLVITILNFSYAFETLPRIAVRMASPYAEFYNTVTGEKFMPIGASYVKLHEIGESKYHANFIPGIYDAQEADSVLKKMSESGYTVVRTFCFKGSANLRNAGLYSIEGPSGTNTATLYQPYLDNLLDFLVRATRYGIYVQLSIDTVPDNNYYNTMYNAGFPDIEGFINREYLVSGAITAKEIYIGKLIDSIAAYAPGLLNTIFGYEIRNEVHSVTDYGPFSRTSGWVMTGNGEEYDMSSASSRQACQNDNIKYWLNKCVSAVKAKDPSAMCCASVFTFLPVGKSGMAGNGLLPITTTDKRWPVLPSVLMQTNVDYLDVHEYIPADWTQSLASSNIGSLDKTIKPFSCGEFGAHRNQYSDVFAAAEALNNHRENILDSGFQGACLFTWDTYNHTRWTAMESNGIVNERLKPDAWHRWHFNTDGFGQFWSAGQGISNIEVSGGIMSVDIDSDAAAIFSPLIRLDTQQYKYLRMKLKNQTQSSAIVLSWTTKADRSWSTDKSVTFDIIASSNEFKTYYVDLSASESWQGLVNQIKIVPVELSISGGNISLDWIEIQPESTEQKQCGEYGYFDSDFNRDCIVDALDFAFLAENWLVTF